MESPSCKVGFLGLGIMGRPMAGHLARAGHQLAIWSHNSKKAEQFAIESGSTNCETPCEVAQRSDFVFICVGDTAMSKEVVLGERGVASSRKRGIIVVDCSTIAPAASREMGEKLSLLGIHLLDAPCTGSKPGAEKAELTFMVGGEEAIFERVLPLFETLGKKVFYCGAAGMGLYAKLAQNLLLANMMQAIAESLAFSERAGIDSRLVMEILLNSAAKSGLLAFKAPFILERDFSTNFSVKWLAKDVKLMLEAASELELELPLTSETSKRLQEAIRRGLGELDICALVDI